MDGKLGILVYDHDCTLCKMLASFLSKSFGKQIEFKAWQEFRTTPLANERIAAEKLQADVPENIHIITDDKAFEGPQAWLWLLTHQPELQNLAWLAKKLNLLEETAQTMNRTTKLIRRACLWCRPW